MNGKGDKQRRLFCIASGGILAVISFAAGRQTCNHGQDYAYLVDEYRAAYEQCLDRTDRAMQAALDCHAMIHQHVTQR